MRGLARTCRLAIAGLAAGVLLACIGCSGSSRLEAEHAGRTVAYEPGVPNFDAEAIVTLREGSTGVDVYVGLPPASLVFLEREGGYVAVYERTVRLVDRASEALVSEIARVDTLRVGSYEATQRYEPSFHRERLEAPPGTYILEATVTDRASAATATRRLAVEVAGAGAEEPYLSGIRLEARRPGEAFEPVLSLHMPADAESLRAVVELYDVAAQPDLEVSFTLSRFVADTTAARPPYWLSPPRGTLAYRGIDYGRADTVQATRRLLTDTDGQAVVEVTLPPLGEGIYRLEVGAAEVAGGRSGDARQRLVAVRDAAFPSVALLDDLIDALAYIAFEGELRAIRAGETPPARKRRFDAFWGSLVPDRQAAASLMKLYYGRIEEANLFFSSHKEGWKTDRGMVYVILGPPLYVETYLDGEVWHYGYGGDDPANVYTFERAETFERDAPFVTYVLQRRPYYQRTWENAVDRWRSGRVL